MVDAVDHASPRTFGIELEFIVANDLVYLAIAAALRQLGLSVTGFQSIDPTGQPDYQQWAVKTEGKWRQFEVISPILMDAPEKWHDVAVVLGLIRTLGGTPDLGSGGHIHAGTAEFVGDLPAQQLLLDTVAALEDLLFRLYTADPSVGHRGLRHTRSLTSQGSDWLPDIDVTRQDRKWSLNLATMAHQSEREPPPATEDPLSEPLPSAALGALAPSPWRMAPTTPPRAHGELRIPDATLDLGFTQAVVRSFVALLDAVAALLDRMAARPGGGLRYRWDELHLRFHRRELAGHEAAEQLGALLLAALSPGGEPSASSETPATPPPAAGPLGHHGRAITTLTSRERAVYEERVIANYLDLLGPLPQPVREQIRALFDRGIWFDTGPKR